MLKPLKNTLYILSFALLLITSCTHQSIVWKTTGTKVYDFDPVIIGQELFYKNRDGSIVAVNMANGRVRKQHSCQVNRSSHLATYQGKIFVGNTTGHLLIINKNLQAMDSFFLNASLKGKAVFEEQVAYFQAQDTIQGWMLVSFDLAQRKVRWKCPLNYVSERTPIIIQDNVILLGYPSVFYKIDKRTGKRLAQVFTNEVLPPDERKKMLSGKALQKIPFEDYFVGHSGSNLYAIHLKTNRFLWYTPNERLLLAIINAHQCFYVSHSKNRVYAMDTRDKSITWSLPLEKRLLSYASMVDHSKQLIVSNNRQLLFINKKTGKVLKTLNLDDKIIPEMFLYRTKLFVATKNQSLYCIDL